MRGHGARHHGHHPRPHGPAPSHAPDAEALLVALTLSPATYSRNRFFEMYRSPEVQRTRRRAGQLRNVVTALAAKEGARGAGRIESMSVDDAGEAEIVYLVPSVGLRRTVRLEAIELALLRYCVGRAQGDDAPAELRPHAIDRERIGHALHRLAPIPRLDASVASMDGPASAPAADGPATEM